MPPPREFFLAACYIFCDRRLISCIAYFLTFLHNVYKWQVSITFRYRVMTLFSRSCHGLFDANAHCCGSFDCFSTSVINLAIHDDSNGYRNESSTTAERWPPYRSYDVIMYDVITGHQNIYVNNSSQNRGRAMGVVSLCLSRQDALNDMQYDLPGSFIRSGQFTWPDQRSHFQLIFRGKNWYVSMHLDERNTMVFRVFLYLF